MSDRLVGGARALGAAPAFGLAAAASADVRREVASTLLGACKARKCARR